MGGVEVDEWGPGQLGGIDNGRHLGSRIGGWGEKWVGQGFVRSQTGGTKEWRGQGGGGQGGRGGVLKNG